MTTSNRNIRADQTRGLIQSTKDLISAECKTCGIGIDELSAMLDFLPKVSRDKIRKWFEILAKAQDDLKFNGREGNVIFLSDYRK